MKFPSRLRTSCCLAVLVATLAGNFAPAAEPLDLSYVSSDVVAAVVAHPRRALAAPEMELMPTEVITAAGLEHAGFDPLDIEQAIVTVGIAGLSGGQPGVGAILKFAKAYDRAAVAAKLGKDTVEKTYHDIKYLAAARPDAPCLCMPDERTLLVGTEPALKAMLGAKNVDSPLIKLLKQTDTSKCVTAVMDFATVRPLVLMGMQQAPPVPPPFEPFLEVPRLVSWIELSLDMQAGYDLGIVIGGNNAADATKLKELADRAKEMARDFIRGQIQEEMGKQKGQTEQAGMKYAQRVVNKLLDDLKIEVENERVRVVPFKSFPASLVSVQTTGVMVALLLPAVQAAREAARRAQSMNNLRQIAIAMMNFEASKGQLPARAIYSKDGKPLLSWRVAILPYVEEAALYNEFHLDEPWDSEHNRKLITRMPVIYRNPNSTGEDGKTDYLAVNGPGTVFGEKEGLTLAKITDGTSNTILVVEADADRAVEWTRPDDLSYDPSNPHAGLGHLRPGIFLASFCDGRVSATANETDERHLRAYMTYAGGDVFQPVRVPR